MSSLQNAQHEAFAVARAKGVRLENAYEDAGYAPGNGHASRLALRPDVMARIAELRRELAEEQDASPLAIVVALVRLANASEDLKSAAGVKEARMNLLEPHRIQGELSLGRRHDLIELSGALNLPG